jgi:hypothetical protein
MFPGPLPTPTVQRPEDSWALRINQRLSAQVLEIANEHVKLLVEGVPVVARLTSPEQAAQLAERRLAQFIVRGADEKTLTLQIAPAPSSEPAPESGMSHLVSRLLTNLNLPLTDGNAHIALALMKQRLPVTAEAVTELARALQALGRTGAAEAEVAARLKAAGLPLGPGALELVATVSPKLGEAARDLEAQLRALARTPPPPQLAERVRAALATLGQLKLDWSAPPKEMAQQLQRIVAAFGRPIEQQLAQANATPNALLALAQLRADLAQLSPRMPSLERALHGLDRLIESARVNQFVNLPPTPAPVTAEGRWLNVHVPLAGPAPANDLSLRIAHAPEGAATAIDPAHTRIVLHIALAEGQALEVDLSVVERQIGARVRASDAELAACAEAELPALAGGIESIGYVLKTARVEVGEMVKPAPSVLAGVSLEA